MAQGTFPSGLPPFYWRGWGELRQLCGTFCACCSVSGCCCFCSLQMWLSSPIVLCLLQSFVLPSLSPKIVGQLFPTGQQLDLYWPVNMACCYQGENLVSGRVGGNGRHLIGKGRGKKLILGSVTSKYIYSFSKWVYAEPGRYHSTVGCPSWRVEAKESRSLNLSLPHQENVLT